VSGPPHAGYGAAVGPVGPPRARRGAATVVLAVLMVLFLVLAGVTTTMLVLKNGDYNRTVAQRDLTITNQNQQIDKVKGDLQQTKDDLDKTRTDLGGSQKQADELKRQKQVISQCISLLGEASDANKRGDPTTANAKLTEAKPVCDEAGKYLD
jgi:septal ring factor EnvC (AmiA/AmiB activator)